MNKMLIFPLGIMFLLTLMVSLTTSIHPIGSSDDYTNQSGINITGSDKEQGSVQIPRAGSQTFDIWGPTGIMVIMIIAISIGIIGGIHILGSGLSSESQMMIFNAIFFLGLWACLTIVSGTVFFANFITIMLWFAITMMFVVGLATHLNGNPA
jgi:hypothetical protein